MIVIGLTGSIGMGKTATAKMFEAEGVPVYDADAAVHELYGPGGAAVGPVSAAFPGVAPNGFIDRTRLGDRVLNDPEALKTLETIVHPLVGAHRRAFFDRVAGEPVVVLDVPLLFETGGDRGVDLVAVVSAPADVQRERVLQRPGMSADRFAAIVSRQTPDAEKCARADVVIDTSQGLEHARDAVRALLAGLRDPQWRGRRPAGLDAAGDAPQ